MVTVIEWLFLVSVYWQQENRRGKFLQVAEAASRAGMATRNRVWRYFLDVLNVLGQWSCD